MKTLRLLFLFSLVAIHAEANILTNGDFSQTYDPVGPATSLPTGWTGLNGSTDNAGVYGGNLLFSTAGLHNATLHKYYVYQSFDAGSGGVFTLSFDYYLENASTGTLINGAKVAIDNWYVPAAEALFSKTYMSEGFTSAWHINQTVTVTLTPGVHVLYLGTIGASQQNDQALVHYDNVSLEAVPPATFSVTASASSPTGGSVAGGGSFVSGGNVALRATANPGYYLVNWTEGGVETSTLADYTFTVGANRTLVANFAPLPVMNLAPPATVAGDFQFAWPATLNWTLEESSDLLNWTPSTRVVTSSGGQNQVSVPSSIGGRFFRLVKP
ncbi:MAG: hypothetical protein JNN17_12590 [Verrucomicrobiaceae bacterium]|nr:hypothetical protein [Verrucomicrobiaceae bacterium]